MYGKVTYCENCLKCTLTIRLKIDLMLLAIVGGRAFHLLWFYSFSNISTSRKPFFVFSNKVTYCFSFLVSQRFAFYYEVYPFLLFYMSHFLIV